MRKSVELYLKYALLLGFTLVFYPVLAYISTHIIMRDAM